ncbi:SAM-dependent chlorinase/fluorinase [candidate division KSB1 bacterium]|nr:SAM-dependent chlorinase/fluorinase [candidate division KSB1 bacterium]
MPIITLLTDFGDKDGFVGTMKGVILSINPSAQIIDIAHHIAAGDIHSGAFVLANSYSYFPGNTIHVVVVDPGVGSDRRALCVQTGGHYFVAPDNGVLKWIFKDNPGARVFELTRQKYFLDKISCTFHGRDIFAPVAAYLSTGTEISQFGHKIQDYVKGNWPKYNVTDKKITGEIIHIDRFGNLVTNIAANDFNPEKFDRLKLPRHTINVLNDAYNLLSGNKPFAIIGSHGFIEIAVKDSSAAELLNYDNGTVIELYLKG